MSTTTNSRSDSGGGERNTSSMYLRVKRPRHVAPLPSLRVDGLLLENETNKRARLLNSTTAHRSVEESHLAAMLHQSTYISEQQQQKQKVESTRQESDFSNPTYAVWKRLEDQSQSHENIKHKRPFRCVDAVLEHVEGDDDPSLSRSAKRRRLTLTLVVPKVDADLRSPVDTVKKQQRKQQSAKHSKGNRILDPMSRLVQDSLQSVLSGDRTVSQHLHFLTHDSRLMSNPNQVAHWLQWQDARGGIGGSGSNIMHAAALQNDVVGVSSILATCLEESDDHNARSRLLTAVDSSGQTPYQVAMAVGHEQVAQVLLKHQQDEEQQDGDYCYDIFLLDKNIEESDSHHDKERDDSDVEPTCVELRGGIGYWNENGELILEALQDERETADSDDDDEDSNREDHEGNDYPDEQFWDSDEEDEIDFRHRPIYMGPGTSLENRIRPLDDDEEEDYDAQYDVYESSDTHRAYAYDAELESESSSSD